MDHIRKFVDQNSGKIVCIDSRKIKTGDIFLAYKGERNDGHQFINDAINKGAVAVIGEVPLSLPVPYLLVTNGRLVWAKIQADLAGNPEKELHFVGVTGTDGKTTTVNLVFEMLKGAGKKVGMISTIGAKYGKNIIETGSHTSTPNAEDLFPILREMKESGIEWVVLETTSHGLAQDRIGDIDFDYGIITNIGSDHLEFHGSLENYTLAKAKLLEKSRVSIINRTITGIEVLKKKAKGRTVCFDYSKQIKNQKYTISKEKITQKFELKYGDKWIQVETELLGKYNIENILAMSAVACDLNVEADDFLRIVGKCRAPKGRFEKIKNKKGINAIVDFAHTEQGLRAIFCLIKEIKNKSQKIIAVFGANGERDRTKRGPMGKAAAELVDIAIITSEDTNNESIDQIFNDIKDGFECAKTGKQLLRIDDRKTAIKEAIKMAKSGDWVLFLGKGHERSMNVGGKEFPWNETKTVKDIFQETKMAVE